MEKRVADLKHRVDDAYCSRGAALKAAPYRTAATLQPLSAQPSCWSSCLPNTGNASKRSMASRWVHRSQVGAAAMIFSDAISRKGRADTGCEADCEE